MCVCVLTEWTGGLWQGWDLYSTVNQSHQTPPMNHVRRDEKRRSRGGHFLSRVGASLMTSSWQGLVDLPHCSWAALVPRIGPVLRSWRCGGERERREKRHFCELTRADWLDVCTLNINAHVLLAATLMQPTEGGKFRLASFPLGMGQLPVWRNGQPLVLS